MSQPLIGVVTFRGDSKYGFTFIQITEAYVQAIIRADGLPCLIPIGLSGDQLDELLLRLSGLLFPGGGDVNPERYKSSMHPKVFDIDDDRDQLEIHLVQRVIDRKLPFLGICRGLQIINVALGGSLYEDIVDQNPGASAHDFFPTFPRSHIAHQVEIKTGSRLENILNQTHTGVNSLHHQGIRDLAPGLQATAFASDGIIEGIELPGHPFGMAVQWHPEWLQDDPAMRALFKAFVKAARSFASDDE